MGLNRSVRSRFRMVGIRHFGGGCRAADHTAADHPVAVSPLVRSPGRDFWRRLPEVAVVPLLTNYSGLEQPPR
jgi:hypothetical protein